MPIAEELKTLQDLHDKGQLTEAEFATAKAATLGKQPATESGFGFAKRLGILLLCLVGLLGFGWYKNGTKATTDMVSTAIHAPIQLTDEVENLPANSFKVIPFNLPYTGSVTVNANLAHGNPIDIFVVKDDQLSVLQSQNWQKVVVYTDFDAQKTQTYERTARLEQGNYYLVLRDTSLGILSARASDISIKIALAP
jgi:hypothetical protein